MDEQSMRSFLTEWGTELSEFANEHGVTLEEWPGFAGAPEEELVEWELQNRLTLPPSYRTFLRVSNGWKWLGPTHLFGGALHALRQVRPLRESNPSLVALYQCDDSEDLSEVDHRKYDPDMDPVEFRRALLGDAIQISEHEAGGVYLLIPTVMTAEGEWEAWSFSSWRPGALRSHSFIELLEAERERLSVIQGRRAARGR